MPKRKKQSEPPRRPTDDETLSESLVTLLGYLNFSRGEPSADFQRGLNALCAEIGLGWRADEVRDRLLAALAAAKSTRPAFADAAQAEAVIPLVTDRLLPAYREFHRDLLFHLSESDFHQPFLLARMFEAALAQGPPWQETERVIEGALDQLNDFLGYRPVAVLENGRKMEPYPHERYRPVPLYIRGVGAAFGPYQEIIDRTVRFFEQAPESLQRESYFDLERMEELSLDVRAHDHLHPANKRTNYMFGEWDPHLIDTKGYYTRFVLRKVILDALLTWITDTARREPGVKRDELLADAAAVLCGTMLMASAISGSGPGVYDSTTTLTSLLPKVARQRDAFYERLLHEATGARARRLKREAKQTQQPFGHVRQRLNIELAKYGSRQVQTRHLAQLYARMGYFEAAREQALTIPTPSARFECDIQCRITETHLHCERGELEPALLSLADVEDLLHRGIECGAIMDPWNILGFQGQYPLFHTREDSLHDMRAEALIEMMERIFRAHGHAVTEAAARGRTDLGREFSQRFGRLAEWWDQFATTTVEDMPKVSGQESVDSARNVAAALSEWQRAGAEAGDITFWRQHVGDFQSPKAYAVVVDALLERGDLVAAMGLLMQWLSETDELGLRPGAYSLNSRLLRWMQMAATEPADPDEETLRTIARLFDYLEANAESLWHAPSIGEATGVPDSFDEDMEGDLLGDEDDLEDWDDEDDVFGAAYDDVVFRDSAADGFAGEVADDGGREGDSAIDLLTDQLEPRLRFLDTLAQLWRTAALPVAATLDRGSLEPGYRRHIVQRVLTWVEHLGELQQGLRRLMRSVWDYDLGDPSGDHDSNVEFDEQLQTQYYLVQTVIATSISCQAAERTLRGALPDPVAPAEWTERSGSEEKAAAAVYRGVLARNAALVERSLPRLLKALARKPLLYVPLSNGGDPEQVRQAQSLQNLMRFLLTELPRLGLLRETWQVLQAAYRMERSSRPTGQAVTEFDQLFRTALRNSADCVIHSARHWRPSRLTDRRGRRQPRVNTRGYSSAARRRRKQRPRWPSATKVQRLEHRRHMLLLEFVSNLVQRYSTLWLKHSRTTRLSAVESLTEPALWRDLRGFIREYGSDLFHARMLTLGNVRTILHNGVDEFLDFLEDVQDPLHPIKLIEDIEQGVFDRDQAVEYLELIYAALVDRIDRFVEYNTTTTQSDYGEMFYCFLDFLRVESAYERDAWNLTPFVIVHEQLAAHAPPEVARLWESVFERRNAEAAERHVQRLAEAEKTHGMHLPALTDRIEERFVKPLSVNRMVALVRPAIADARAGRKPSAAFGELQREIQAYLESTSGSGVDVAPWLRSIERQVRRIAPYEEAQEPGETPAAAPASKRPEIIGLRKLRRQFRHWEDATRKRNPPTA